jgi:hypothetical protein
VISIENWVGFLEVPNRPAMAVQVVAMVAEAFSQILKMRASALV